MHDDGNYLGLLSFVPIGVIHSPFTDIGGMPIQPNGAGASGVPWKFLKSLEMGSKILKVFPDSSSSMLFIAASRINFT